MPTAIQIDELEELLRTFHNKKHSARTRLELCTEPKCMEALFSIAWLRTQIRTTETGQLQPVKAVTVA